MTSLKSTAIVAFYVHAVLMNFTYSFRRWLIECGHTLAGYAPLKITVAKEDVRILNESESSTRYWFPKNKVMEMEERAVVGSETTSRYLHMTLWQTALEM